MILKNNNNDSVSATLPDSNHFSLTEQISSISNDYSGGSNLASASQQQADNISASSGATESQQQADNISASSGSNIASASQTDSIGSGRLSGSSLASGNSALADLTNTRERLRKEKRSRIEAGMVGDLPPNAVLSRGKRRRNPRNKRRRL